MVNITLRIFRLNSWNLSADVEVDELFSTFVLMYKNYLDNQSSDNLDKLIEIKQLQPSKWLEIKLQNTQKVEIIWFLKHQ